LAAVLAAKFNEVAPAGTTIEGGTVRAALLLERVTGLSEI